MMREGGLPLADVFQRTRLRVNETTMGAEVPWHASRVQLPRIRLPSHPQSTGRMACQLHAEAQEMYCAVTETQGCVPPLPIAASGSGRAVD